RPERFSRMGAVMACPYLALAAVLLHSGRGQGNSGGAASAPGGLAGEARGYLRVDSRSLERHGEALFDRGSRRTLREAHRRRSLRLLDQFLLRRLAVRGV